MMKLELHQLLIIVYIIGLLLLSIIIFLGPLYFINQEGPVLNVTG